MDIQDLNEWCRQKCEMKINVFSKTPVKLENYKIVFNHYSNSRNCGTANIVKSEGDSVYGLLLEIDQDSYKSIEKKEGSPKVYSEIKIDVESFDKDKIRDVVTFKLLKEKEKETHQSPSEEYLGLLVKNSEKYGFPEEYTKYLRSIQTK